MPFSSKFYDTLPGEGIKETEWAQSAISRGPLFGVVGKDDFALTPHPTTPYAVNIGPGKAWGHGVWDDHTGSTTVASTAPAQGATRWDMIAIRRDWQPSGGGPSALRSVAGNTSQALPAGRENRPGVVADQGLWLVQWQGGQTQPRSIIDLRIFASAAGGVEIAHTLARGFLEHPGSRVTLADRTWYYRNMGNGVWDWTRGQFTQAQNVTVNTNDAGDAYWTFPEAFSERLESVIVGDTSSPVSWPMYVARWVPAYSSLTRGCARIYDMNGRAVTRTNGLWLAYQATGK